MSRSLTPVVVVVAAAGPLGCHRAAVPGSTVEARRQGDATIIEDDVLRHAGGSILNILPGYVAGMQVRHNSGCPEITLRGKKSLVNSNDPVVYVDGTRSGNTCVLDSLVPSDVVIPQSVNKGIPVVQTAPKSSVAKAIHELADLFITSEARGRRR